MLSLPLFSFGRLTSDFGIDTWNGHFFSPFLTEHLCCRDTVGHWHTLKCFITKVSWIIFMLLAAPSHAVPAPPLSYPPLSLSTPVMLQFPWVLSKALFSDMLPWAGFIYFSDVNCPLHACGCCICIPSFFLNFTLLYPDACQTSQNYQTYPSTFS